jgi:DNA repair exonuclease SbcCD ATPase subunit
MHILTLTIKNFMPFASAVLHLNDRGLVLVEGKNHDSGGSNGAGKSSIFEALCWGLFGVTSRGFRGSQVNRLGCRNTEVSIDLAIGEDRICVSRYRDHDAFNNKLIIRSNGKDITGPGDRESQVRLNDILKLNWDSFRNVVMFPQGVNGFASLTDAEQKEILETILGLDRFSVAQFRAKKLLTSLNTNLKSALANLNIIKTRIEENTSALQKIESSDKIFKESHTKQLADAESSMWFLQNSRPKSLQPVLDELYKYQILAEESHRDDYINLSEQASYNIQQIRNRQTELKAKSSTLRFFAQSKPPEEYSVDITAPCPSCGQALPKDAMSHLIDERIKQKDKDAEQVLNFLLEADKLDLECSELDLKLSQSIELQNKVNLELEKTSEINDTLSQLETAVKDLRSEHQLWEAKLAEAQRQLDRVKRQVSPYSEMLKTLNAKLSDLNEKLTYANLEIEPLQEQVKYAEFWVNGFGNQGLKSLLLDTITPFLNQTVQEYLDDLTGGSARVIFTTQVELANGEKREKFNIELKYKNGSDDYRGISGGERRRVDIAVLFALGDLAASRSNSPVRLRLLDEPFSDLDSQGEEQVVNLLRKRILPKSGTVLVMTHSDSLKSLFEKRICVEKRDGVSEIIEDVL